MSSVNVAVSCSPNSQGDCSWSLVIIRNPGSSWEFNKVHDAARYFRMENIIETYPLVIFVFLLRNCGILLLCCSYFCNSFFSLHCWNSWKQCCSSAACITFCAAALCVLRDVALMCLGQGLATFPWETTVLLLNSIWSQSRNWLKVLSCNVTRTTSWPASNSKIFLVVFVIVCSALPYLWDCKLFLMKLRRLIATNRYLSILPSNYPQSSGQVSRPWPANAADRFLFLNIV